jgi:hypothetical protein
LTAGSHHSPGQDPKVQLVVTEGEKKALAATQVGLCCVALGGLWSWSHGGRPIEDLGGIDWYERRVWLIPDSDIWTRPDLRQPVYALARELQDRGASILVLKLPTASDGTRVGLDDFLLTHDRAALEALPQVDLKHKVFAETAGWWKRWRTRKDAGADTSALELLARGETVRRLHPAQDVTDGVLWYGLPVAGELVMVTSTREVYRADTLPAGFALRHSDPGVSSVSRDAALLFQGGTAGTVAGALDALTRYLERYLVFRDSRTAEWVATWALGTWCFRAFTSFPYLWIRSAEKRCGKTRLMRLLARVAFNCSASTVNPTEAGLYRAAERTSGTQLIDEADNLKGAGKDKADPMAALISVLNAGFEAGGAVSRLEKRGESFVNVDYAAYCPRIIVGLKGLKDTLEDRSLPVLMVRKRRDEPVARMGRASEAEAATLRQDCALAVLSTIRDILRAYEKTFAVLEAAGIDDRAVDLWAPLLALAMVADVERDGTRARRLTQIAQETGEARDASESTGHTAGLVAALQQTAGTSDRVLSPTELLAALRAAGQTWLKSAKTLHSALAPLGLYSRAVWNEGKARRGYHLEVAPLADLASRFGSADSLPGLDGSVANES